MNQTLPTAKKRILVIEDETTFRDMITVELGKAGYDILTARDGSEGVEKMRLEQPNLVLLDLVMPRKNGFWVIEEMKRDEVLSKIPIVVFSNSGDIVELSKVKDMGVEDVFIKTAFGPKEFLEKVNGLLSKHPSSEGDIQGSSHGHILLIEDDPFLWSLIRTKLMREGFKVSIAEDGAKGLAKAKEMKPDLILLDLVLPDVEGFSILEQLKTDEATSSVPVVILSNLGQEQDVSKGIALGAKDYLIKAHHAPQEIVDKVKQVLIQKLERV